MSALHTADLDHAIAEALRNHRADSIRFTHDPDLAHPYGVEAWAGPDYFLAMGDTPSAALAAAMATRTTGGAV